MNDDEDMLHGFWRSILMMLQVLAIALCLCIVARFAIEDAARIPNQMCVEAAQ